MASNLSQTIVELNNKAVTFLLQGHHEQAITTLGDALLNLKVYRELEAATSTSSTNNVQFHHQTTTMSPQQQQQCCCSPTNDHTNKHVACPISSVPLGFYQDSQQQRMNAFTSTFSIFDQALTVANADELESLVSKNYNKLFAMLLFNMGLSLHMKAVNTGKAPELEGALQLYEMTFSVVEEAWSEFAVDDLMLFLLGMFNNMGHIHSVLVRSERAKTCVEWLKSLSANPMFLRLMQKQEYAPFFLNLLVVLKQDQFLICSPAA